MISTVSFSAEKPELCLSHVDLHSEKILIGLLFSVLSTCYIVESIISLEPQGKNRILVITKFKYMMYSIMIYCMCRKCGSHKLDCASTRLVNLITCMINTDRNLVLEILDCWDHIV